MPIVWLIGGAFGLALIALPISLLATPRAIRHMRTSGAEMESWVISPTHRCALTFPPAAWRCCKPAEEMSTRTGVYGDGVMSAVCQGPGASVLDAGALSYRTCVSRGIRKGKKKILFSHCTDSGSEAETYGKAGLCSSLWGLEPVKVTLTLMRGVHSRLTPHFII